MQSTESHESRFADEVRALRTRVATLERANWKLARQRNAKDTLGKTSIEWERAFDAAQDSIMIVDDRFRIVRANPATSQFLGSPIEKMIGQTCWKIIHGKDGPCSRCPLRVAKKTGKHEQEKVYVSDRNIWEEVSVDPILNNQGHIDTFILILRDISEHRHRREAHVENEKKFSVMYAERDQFGGAARRLTDGTEHGKAMERERQCIREQEFLSESAETLTQFPVGENLYKYIASRIRELAPDAIVAVNSYDKELGGLRVRELLGIGSRTQAIIKLMGANPVGKCFEINAAAREGLGRADLVKVPGGIYDLSPGIPRAVCQAIEKLLGLGDVYGIGMNWKGELLGSIIILTRSRNELSHKSLIETFIRQAAVALQRAEVESELQQSEKRLEVTIDAVSLGTWDWNLTTGHIVWAGHHDRLFGFAPGEFDGRYETFESRIHPDDLPGFRQAVKQSLCLRADYAHEYRIVWPDGTTHWIAAQGRYHWDLKGQPTRMLGIISDITNRKQAEEAYRSLVDHSLQGLLIFQDEHVVFANRTMAQITGYSVEEMLTMTSEKVQAFVHPDDREMVWSRHKQRLKGEVLPEQYEIRGIRKDSSVCWLEIHAGTTEYHGRPAIQAAYVDITDRKGVEKVLRESEQRLKILFESVPDGLYLNDMEGNLLDGNAAAERLTGYARQELIGRNILEVGLLSPKEIPKALAALARTAGRKAAGPDEFTLRRKDGDEVVVEIRAYPVEIDNRMLSLGIVRDITERKRAEHLLRRERDKVQQYLDVAAVMMVAVDSEQRVGLINKRGCEILGYEEQEILGKNWFDNFLPDRDRGKVKAIFEKFAGGQAGAREYFENLILTKDGRELLIAWHNTMLKDDEGNFVAILSSGEDITNRRRAEDALRKQRLLSQVFLDSMPCVAILLRPQTLEVVAVNKEAAKIGAVPGTTGRGPWIHGETPSPEDLAAQMQNTREHQHSIIKQNGLIWDVHWVPIERDLCLYYAFDVTQYTKVEEALRQSEEQFRTAFEFSPNGMCLMSLDGKLLSVNRAMSKIFGCGRKELQGKHLDDITHPEDRELGREAIRRMLSGEIPGIALEKRYVRKTGEVVCAQVNAVLLRDVSGKPIHFITQVADVTDRKKTQERLLEYQAKLKAMASEMLRAEDRERKRIAVGLHDDICQKLALTKLAIESSLGLISDSKLSASLRIASGAIGEVIEETDSLTFELSNPILREFGLVAATARYLNDEIWKKHGIRCEFERSKQTAALPDEIATCLFRMTRELLTNVVKHAHASKIKVSIQESQGWIQVSVQDNGHGFRDAETVAEGPKKTRFGLFSIREQLEVMGGYLDIESEPGGGATVTVIVPLEEKAHDQM